MEKEKMLLADGTEMELEAGASLANLLAVYTSKTGMLAAWEKLTAENLADVQIQTAAGLRVAAYTDLTLVQVTAREQTDGKILATFWLREKSDVEKRLDAVEEGQAIQDGAIEDIAAVTSTLAEGGTQ